MYLTYEYYSTTFGGAAIPFENFAIYERKARILLDYVTFNRLRENESLLDDNVKDCICEVMEVKKKIDDTGGIKSAESVDKLSVTYVVNPNTTEFIECYKVIKTYLGHTDLLYRGVSG